MSKSELLGYVMESSLLDEFTFAVLENSVSKVFKNSYVIVHPEGDPTAVTLARIIKLTSPIRGDEAYVAKCKVLATIDAKKKLRPLLRPIRTNREVFRPSDRQLSEFFGTSEPSLTLGSVSGFPNVKFFIPLEAFAKTSTLITGMTGSGKTSTVLTILRRLAEHDFANLVFDIHGEYRENLKNKARILIPGNNFTLKFDTRFISVLSESVDLSTTEVRILYEIYSRYGEDLDRTLNLLREEVTARLPRISASVYSRIESRLTALYRAGILSKRNVQTKEISLEQGITVLDLSELPVEYQCLLINYALTYSLNIARKDFKNPLYIVLEEAHRFISVRGRIRIPTVQNIMFQGRKYGVNLCLVTQKPSLCDPILLSNCSLQLIHALRNPIDLRALTEISEFIEEPFMDEIMKLTVGEVLVFGPKIRFPTIVRVDKKFR